MHISKRKKPFHLSERGHIHFILPLLVVVLVAFIGGYVYRQVSKAASTTNADYFQSGITGKCLDDLRDATTEGTTIDSYACNKTAAQQWTLNKEINNTFMIENANGSCLDNWQAKKTSGNPIKLYNCNPKDNAQLWSTTGNVLKNPMTGMCIEDPNGSTTNGTPLKLYACNGATDQRWNIVAASTKTSTGGTGGSGTTPAPTPAPTPTTTSPSGKTLGFYDGNHSPTGIETTAKWLGSSSDAQYAMDFLDDTSWSTISNPSWFISQWKGSPYTMVWGVPMVPCGAPSTSCNPNASDFDAVANGSDDSYYKTLAQNLVAGGFGSSYIRLGWEFQGSWFPWNTCSADGQKDFVPAFRNIVTTMRGVSSNFKFIWNPDDSANTSCAGQIENYYPGDSYVNAVALDVYDTNGGSDSDSARWTDLLNGVNAGGWTATAPQSINGQSFKGYGLTWLAAFGKEHGKQIALPEWGLWNDGSSAGGGDDTYFIDQMSNWIKANATGPTIYWNYGTSTLTVPGETSGNNPNATAEFKKDFAGY